MKYIIFDCDSTVGLPGKPMDDADILYRWVCEVFSIVSLLLLSCYLFG